jgi:putative DNA modification/repair radical SAM protein
VDISIKLAILADAAKYDASCASSGVRRKGNGKLGNATGVGICHSYTPDGRCVSLLKILLTNFCIFDCLYCVNRISSNTPRARFTPEEVADLTIQFYKRNYIEGLFLSSGIIQSPDYTMEQLVRSAKLLREAHQFNGYIHLKAVPGASAELIELAGRYADRLSANIELPTVDDLTQLAPEKDFNQIKATMEEMSKKINFSRRSTPVIRNPEKPLSLQIDPTSPEKTQNAKSFAPAGQSTQMIVGATASTDVTILQTASELYQRYQLRRVYYSAYSLIPHHDPRLPGVAPPLLREHRLYQADWLLRFYGFQLDEIASATDGGQLHAHVDPKLAWALSHRERFPIDVNKASRHQLLRIPGLGVRNVDRIIRMRRVGRLRLDDLMRLQVPLNRSRPFIITADYHPSISELDRITVGTRGPSQPTLFDLRPAVAGPDQTRQMPNHPARTLTRSIHS